MTALIFASNTASLGFAVAFICFFAAEQIGGFIIPAFRRGGAKVQRLNASSNLLVYLSWIPLIAFVVVFGKMGFVALPYWAYFAGLALMFFGIAFRQWAIAVLGRFFSSVIGVQAEHKVVQSGPYRLIRHPSYTGVLIFDLGMALAFQSGAAIIAAMVIFGVAYGHRIFVEEKVLKQELGDSYLQYMKHTKRLIPYLV